MAVRFADITGNGRTDYLCIEKDGRVSGFTQDDNAVWTHVPQIKFPEGKDRANLRWADINGDGKADMICTQPDEAFLLAFNLYWKSLRDESIWKVADSSFLLRDKQMGWLGLAIVST